MSPEAPRDESPKTVPRAARVSTSKILAVLPLKKLVLPTLGDNLVASRSDVGNAHYARIIKSFPRFPLHSLRANLIASFLSCVYDLNELLLTFCAFCEMKES